MVTRLHARNSEDMTIKDVKGLIEVTLKKVMYKTERAGHLEYKGNK